MLFEEFGERNGFSELRDFFEKHFDIRLSTQQARDAMARLPSLNLKQWELSPTLEGTIANANEQYRRSYTHSLAGTQIIERTVVGEILSKLQAEQPPTVLLVTGTAGSGKSLVVRGVMGGLTEAAIPHLAFRVDRHLDATSPKAFGLQILDRNESPVTTMKGRYRQRRSVIIIDQVDAVSELSGRDGSVREAVLAMVREARMMESITIILVCRAADFENDHNLKKLSSEGGNSSFEKVAISNLDWETEVQPALTRLGIETEGWTASQRELLCLPLHFGIFCELKEDGRPSDSRRELFDRLLEQKRRSIENSSAPFSLMRPLVALSEWMSDRQMLDAPISILDHFSGALDRLTSEGLIIRSESRIAYFHESLFDYCFARSFLIKSQSIVDMLCSSEQHLFRRTQVRQILEVLRSEDRERYLRELESLLSCEKIRYHVKRAGCQWLGSLDAPMRREWRIVQTLDDGSDDFPPLLRMAIWSSPGWFDLLLEQGWVANVLSSGVGKRPDTILWWLRNVAADRPQQVADILRSWWGGNPDRGNRLLRWFNFVRLRHQPRPVIDLLLELISARPTELFAEVNRNHRDMVMIAITQQHAELGGAVVRSLFDAWFEAFPDEFPFEGRRGFPVDFHSLQEMAEKAPVAFLEGTTDALLSSIRLTEHPSGSFRGRFRHRVRSGHPFAEDQLVALYRNALCTVAKNDPSLARKTLDRLPADLHPCLLHLHLEVISANPAKFHEHLLTLLSADALFDAGWNGAEWLSFAEAAKASFPYLSEVQKQSVERRIIEDREELERAIADAKDIARNGEGRYSFQTRKGVIRQLNGVGFTAWCILKTIGPHLLTAHVLQEFHRLERKFRGWRMPKPSHAEARIVPSPIKPEKTAFMTDGQWIAAFRHYQRGARNFGEGGPRELGYVLQQRAKEAPGRFAALALKIPDDVDHRYLDRILNGLAEAKPPDFEGMVKAVLHAHTRHGRPHGDAIVRLFQACPGLAMDPTLFGILLWYAEHGEAPEEPESEEKAIEQEILKVEDLLHRGGQFRIRGINSVRGQAAEALALVLWHFDGLAPTITDFLESRVKCEPLISVRCCFVSLIPPLYNHDRENAGRLLEAIIRPPAGVPSPVDPESSAWLAPLMTWDGMRMMLCFRHSIPDLAFRLTRRLLEADTDNPLYRQLGAWHVFVAAYDRESDYSPLADSLVEEDVVYRRLAADIAADMLENGEDQERAIQSLDRFFDDDDNEVNRLAAHAFREIPVTDTNLFDRLARPFLRSRAFHTAPSDYVFQLEEMKGDITDILLLTIEESLKKYQADTEGARPIFSEFMRLERMISREYAASASDSGLRARILDIIDELLRLDIHGVEQIVEEHERR